MKCILKHSTVSQLVWILLILGFVYSWRDKIPWSPLRTLSGNEGSLVAYVIWTLLIFPVCLSDPLLQFKRHINLRYKVQLFGEFTNFVFSSDSCQFSPFWDFIYPLQMIHVRNSPTLVFQSEHLAFRQLWRGTAEGAMDLPWPVRELYL